MSQQEFEQLNQEAMDLANRVKKGTTPRSAARSTTTGKGAEGGLISPRAALGRNDSGGVKVDTYMYSRAELARRTLLYLIQVLACLLMAILFVVALLDEAFVKFLTQAGVLVCCMVAAVLTDRAVREWKDKGRDRGCR